jgi:hypothetical protein
LSRYQRGRERMSERKRQRGREREREREHLDPVALERVDVEVRHFLPNPPPIASFVRLRKLHIYIYTNIHIYIYIQTTPLRELMSKFATFCRSHHPSSIRSPNQIYYALIVFAPTNYERTHRRFRQAPNADPSEAGAHVTGVPRS